MGASGPADLGRALIADLQQALAAGADPTERCAVAAGWLLGYAATAIGVGVLLFVLGGHQAAFLLVNDAAAGLADRFWELLTVLGDERLAFALTLLFARRSPRVFWALVCAALIAVAYSRGLKPIVDAPRPPAVLPPEAFHLIGPGHRGESFPSGHSVTAAVFFGVLACFVRSARLRLGLLLLATLVGISRVAVGVHWPVDVAAGLAGGTLAAVGGVLIARRTSNIGARVSVHLSFVLLALLMAASLWVDDGGYAGAATPLKLIAAACIANVVLAYVLIPLARQR